MDEPVLTDRFGRAGPGGWTQRMHLPAATRRMLRFLPLQSIGRSGTRAGRGANERDREPQCVTV